MAPRTLWLFTLVVSGLAFTLAQEQADSPIYKSYRPPSPSSILRRSDASYNIVQFFILERRANSGDAGAQHELGLRYLLGEGVQADTAKGAYWIERSAGQGHNEAQFNLGILCFNGWGVPWNPFKAYRHFRAAAEQGMHEAEYLLGMFLTENLVVPRNWEEAYQWVKKAALSGHSNAKEALADFEARSLGVKTGGLNQQGDTTASRQKPAVKHTLGFIFLDPDTAAQNDATLLKDALREAPPTLRKALGLPKRGAELGLDTAGFRAIRDAAEEGSPEALTILGRCYERGIGVPKDLISASVYYLRAIRMSSPRAPGLLARMIEQEEYVPYLKARIERSDADAEYVWAALSALQLDYLLAKNQGFVTEKQALELLTKAANTNHVQAIIELGLCYYAGRWVEENIARAQQLWNRAAALGSREAQTRIAVLGVREKPDPQRVKAVASQLEEAAAAGSVLAQVALGYCYETGWGIPPNSSDAARFYRSAAQRGSQDAYAALKRMHDRIRPPDKEYQISEPE